MSPPRDINENTLSNPEIQRPREPIVSPYSSKSDPNSNVSSFKIIDTTLRGIVYNLYSTQCINSCLYRGRAIC